jgi:hypothetical protein
MLYDQTLECVAAVAGWDWAAHRVTLVGMSPAPSKSPSSSGDLALGGSLGRS